MERRWAKISEAAHYLGISPKRLRKGIESGYLKKGVHWGELPWMRGILINLEAVEQLLTDGECDETIDLMVERLLS